MSSEEIVGAYSIQTRLEPQTQVEKLVRRRYEVWTDKTLVLRTVHEQQAYRRATEVQGEVKVITHFE
ncbi:MAG TPA: hypothetical protein VKP60_17465 [Magnetospirillaceae bacterium]|nr:hypothetical protein [Magnetospirillaceae bacterium]